MLLYKDGEFMQALEGDEAQVHSLSAQIAKDPRHKELSLIHISPPGPGLILPDSP